MAELIYKKLSVYMPDLPPPDYYLRMGPDHQPARIPARQRASRDIFQAIHWYCENSHRRNLYATAMQGQTEAQNWVKKLGIEGQCHLAGRT